ncbi:MAG: hypothetical protein Q4C70_01245 [Planctomycetia bacterium]|nr:hypothetical protein [Planctomycetia bacterium]
MVTHLEFCRNQIAFRSREEIAFWEGKILEIESYSREKAISELLHALKLRQKIQAIRQFVTQLPKAVEELNDST